MQKAERIICINRSSVKRQLTQRPEVHRDNAPAADQH